MGCCYKIPELKVMAILMGSNLLINKEKELGIPIFLLIILQINQ